MASQQVDFCHTTGPSVTRRATPARHPPPPFAPTIPLLPGARSAPAARHSGPAYTGRGPEPAGSAPAANGRAHARNGRAGGTPPAKGGHPPAGVGFPAGRGRQQQGEGGRLGSPPPPPPPPPSRPPSAPPPGISRDEAGGSAWGLPRDKQAALSRDPLVPAEGSEGTGAPGPKWRRAGVEGRRGWGARGDSRGARVAGCRQAPGFCLLPPFADRPSATNPGPRRKPPPRPMGAPVGGRRSATGRPAGRGPPRAPARGA